MKALLVLLASILCTTSMVATEGNNYPHTMTVTELKTAEDLVAVTDAVGHTWEFKGIEDWQIGDICSCIMNDNGTEQVEDDIIVDKRYDGNGLNLSVAFGEFFTTYEAYDGIQYYQFRSYDDAEWWALTEEDIGYKPELGKQYTLIYHNNGTTECYECAEEIDCECEVYDDVFVALR